MSKLEGNGAARIIQLMSRHGHNTDVNVELGTVISAPPSIVIRLDGDNFELDKDDIMVGFGVSTSLIEGDRVIVLSAKNSQQYFVLDKAVIY
ncbi:DUF2577 domain-containing protein [Cytobacillus gottheilii]|uniref:DUF2577 domain-containing protein n=1 Tax=Cytobacillus gottheilii TaxID=859144 RepID=A0ABX8FG48_9BACI|nr:DUF2577 domain-containing protein [Cytobacillus gottheilii]QVY62993.1 hypothetical protein J1899_08115 [Cytobacillus gottheilii]